MITSAKQMQSRAEGEADPIGKQQLKGTCNQGAAAEGDAQLGSSSWRGHNQGAAADVDKTGEQFGLATWD